MKTTDNQDALQFATQNLLAPADMAVKDLTTVLHHVAEHAVDYADIYCQGVCAETWSLEDGIVNYGSYDIERGVGVRAVSGEKTGFAFSDDIALPSLMQAASTARSIARHGQSGRSVVPSGVDVARYYPGINPLASLTQQDKIALLQRADKLARDLDKRVIQVNASLSGVHEVVLVLNTDGQLAADIRPLVRCNISVVLEDKGRRESGYAGGGGRYDYQQFLQEDLIRTYTEEAVRQATVNLNAVEAPAGTMPVVLGPGWPGVLLHEAIGHGLEGDFNRKGASAFSELLGKRVAAPNCTIVDDGTLAGRRGSLSIDDEGTASQCTVLIEDGILREYMQDKLNARLMGMSPTGNARRESYAHLPMPRMTNTYMLPGEHLPEEIIASVKRGIYAVNFGGGQVDITSGKFVFSANEAYLIENGKVTTPVKGATLIGNGPDVLTKVSMVGNDLALDTGVGVCGKEGQSVPVGVGQPTLKVDALTVGGTC